MRLYVKGALLYQPNYYMFFVVNNIHRKGDYNYRDVKYRGEVAFYFLPKFQRSVPSLNLFGGVSCYYDEVLTPRVVRQMLFDSIQMPTFYFLMNKRNYIRQAGGVDDRMILVERPRESFRESHLG